VAAKQSGSSYTILDFGFWILDFGFWILDFGFWILGAKHPSNSRKQIFVEL